MTEKIKSFVVPLFFFLSNIIQKNSFDSKYNKEFDEDFTSASNTQTTVHTEVPRLDPVHITS